VFGIDVDDPDLMAARTWRWLRARIVALQTSPGTRLARSLSKPRR
jgi:hypothetical protein